MLQEVSAEQKSLLAFPSCYDVTVWELPSLRAANPLSVPVTAVCMHVQGCNLPLSSGAYEFCKQARPLGTGPWIFHDSAVAHIVGCYAECRVVNWCPSNMLVLLVASSRYGTVLASSLRSYAV